MILYYLRQLLSILLLPGVVTVLVPWLILRRTGSFQPGGLLTAPWNILLMVVGGLFFLFGLALMVSTIILFVRVGKGTLAPWDPTRKLVIRGPYRHVRNPMISGVLAVLLGESLFFASLPLLGFFGFAGLLNMIYIPLSEEPDLIKRFGEDYLTYCQHVRRWIPRIKPWKG
jgi:protein-S-isoprenylcysteine O-methyltransferase Ste14